MQVWKHTSAAAGGKETVIDYVGKQLRKFGTGAGLRMRVAVAATVLVVMAAGPAWAGAPFSLGVFGGFGGSIDENEAGLGQTTVMAKLTIESGPRTDFALRLGEMDIEQLGERTDATLNFLTLSGDYWAYESFYESALYLGLGYYELSAFEGFDVIEETTIGVVLGASGEWDLTRILSIQLELSAHYAPMDTAQTFLMGLGGLVVHF